MHVLRSELFFDLPGPIILEFGKEGGRQYAHWSAPRRLSVVGVCLKMFDNTADPGKVRLLSLQYGNYEVLPSKDPYPLEEDDETYWPIPFDLRDMHGRIDVTAYIEAERRAHVGARIFVLVEREIPGPTLSKRPVIVARGSGLKPRRIRGS